MNGIVDAKAQHQRRHGRFQCGEPRTGDVQDAVRPNQGAGQADEREGHAGKRPKRNREHHDDHGKGEEHQKEEVVEGTLVNVVGQQIVGNHLVSQG